MIQTKYANAYTEVYEILSCLNEDEYLKIPKELMEVFEENRNLDYEYQLNEEQDLMKQPMLIETKAILLNIFRDYLATPKQRDKILQWLQEDREYLEKKKKEEYGSDVFDTEFGDNKAEESEQPQLPLEIKEKNSFMKFIVKLKNFLLRKI